MISAVFVNNKVRGSGLESERLPRVKEGGRIFMLNLSASFSQLYQSFAKGMSPVALRGHLWRAQGVRVVISLIVQCTYCYGKEFFICDISETTCRLRVFQIFYDQTDVIKDLLRERGDQQILFLCIKAQNSSLRMMKNYLNIA